MKHIIGILISLNLVCIFFLTQDQVNKMSHDYSIDLHKDASSYLLSIELNASFNSMSQNRFSLLLFCESVNHFNALNSISKKYASFSDEKSKIKIAELMATYRTNLDHLYLSRSTTPEQAEADCNFMDKIPTTRPLVPGA